MKHKFFFLIIILLCGIIFFNIFYLFIVFPLIYVTLSLPKINIIDNFDNLFYFQFANIFIYLFIFSFLFYFLLTFYYYYFKVNYYSKHYKNFNFRVLNFSNFKFKNFFYYYFIKINDNTDKKFNNKNFLLIEDFVNKIGNFNYALVVDNDFFNFRHNIYFTKFNDLKKILILFWSIFEFFLFFFVLYKLIFLYYKFDFLMIFLNFDESFLPYNRLNFKGFISFSSFISICFIFSCLIFSFYLWIYENSDEEFETNEQDFWFYNTFLSHLRVLFYIFIFFLLISFAGLSFFNLIFFCSFQIFIILKECVATIFNFSINLIEGLEKIFDVGFFSPFYYLTFFNHIFFFNDNNILPSYSNLSLIFEQELWKYELLMDFRKKNRFILENNNLIFYNELINKNFFGFGIKLDGVHLKFNFSEKTQKKMQYFRTNVEMLFDPLYNPILKENTNDNFLSFNAEFNIENLRFNNLELSDFYDLVRARDYYNYNDSIDSLNYYKKSKERLIDFDFFKNTIVLTKKTKSDFVYMYVKPKTESTLNNLKNYFNNLLFKLNMFLDFKHGIDTENHEFWFYIDQGELDFPTYNNLILSRKKNLKLNFYNFFTEFKKNSFSNKYWFEDFYYYYLNNESFYNAENYFFDCYDYLSIQKVNDNFFFKPFFYSKKLDFIFFHFNWLNLNDILLDYFSFSVDLEEENDLNLNNNFFNIDNQFFDFLNDFYNEYFFIDNDDTIIFEFYDSDTGLLVYSENLNENSNSYDSAQKISDFLPVKEEEMVDDVDVPLNVNVDYVGPEDFFVITGEEEEIEQLETLLGVNAFFDINKFINFYSINDFLFTNNFRDDVIYSNNFGFKFDFKIDFKNYNNFYLNIFNSYYILESKIQNFIFFQNTVIERYLYKYYGASIITENLSYELTETFIEPLKNFQKIIIYPSFKRSNSVFFQQLYSFNWRNFKEKFIEFPFRDYIFPYKKYKFFGLDKLFFNWKNDGTVFKNHNSDYFPEFLDYLDDLESVYFLEFPQTHFYHRDLTQNFMLADYNSSLILKDYQNGLFYDKKNYFLNNYLFNFLLYNIDISLNEFIEDYFFELNNIKTLFETPLGAGIIIFPFLTQNDIFFIKRGVSDNYLRTTSFEISSIFERLNIRLMDFVNRLIFLDFEKRNNLFIKDLWNNINFFDFIHIFTLLRGFDPWNLYKINSIFNLNQIDLLLNDQKLFNFDSSDDSDDVSFEIRNRESHAFFRKFNFHILDNLDFILFPYRNHYIFPSKFFFIKSDLKNFLEVEGVSDFLKLKHLNDINSLNNFDIILFLENFLNEENENFLSFSSDNLIIEEINNSEIFEDFEEEINDFEELVDDQHYLYYYEKKPFFDKFIIKNQSTDFLKLKKKRLKKFEGGVFEQTQIKYKTFAPRFEIGFPNNRNFFHSLIFKKFNKVLFQDPYLFGLYNFPYDNSYSFFWVNFLRSIFLKNQFISQIRNDRIFSNEFFFNNLVYKRISYLYMGDTTKVTLTQWLYNYGIISRKNFLRLEGLAMEKTELFYPLINWFFFDEWKISRFRKYSFSYFKNFRIFFNSSKKISIFLDRRGNVSFVRYPTKIIKLSEEYDTIYHAGKSKRFEKSILKYPRFSFDAFLFFFQSFFSFCFDKLNITKFFILISKFSSFNFLNFNIKTSSAKYEILLYKRRQRYARFLYFVQDKFPFKKEYNFHRLHNFNIFYIFYSMENLTRNFNNMLTQISAMPARSFHFRFLINKIKPTPELIIFRNNDIRLKKIINQIYFFKALCNFNYKLNKNSFWLYFFKNNFIDTRLFNLPIDFFLIEKYPQRLYIFEPINDISLKFRVLFYDNLNFLTRFNYHFKSVKHCVFDINILFVQRCYKWTYFGFGYYGFMYNDINFYKKIFYLDYFQYTNFHILQTPYFNHLKSFKLKSNTLLYNNKFVNVKPLGYLKTKNFFNFTLTGDDMFFGIINPNYNSNFENYYKSIDIFKYISKIISFNNDNSINFLTIYTPYEYEIYKKEKFLNWLKFNRYRRIIKHYNSYFSNYLYFSNFFAVSDLYDFDYLSIRDFFNHNFISDYFLEQNEEDLDDHMLQSRQKFYIPYKHEYWYFSYPDKIFIFNSSFLQQYHDVLNYFQYEIFDQTLKVINLKIAYDVFKIKEIENIIDILYIYNLNENNNFKKVIVNNFNFDSIVFSFVYLFLIFNYLDFGINNMYLNFYHLFINVFSNYSYFILFINNICIFLIKLIYFVYKFFIYAFLKIYYVIYFNSSIFNFFSKIVIYQEYFSFLNYSFLFFWIHFYLFPCWIIIFFVFSNFSNMHLFVEPRLIDPRRSNIFYKFLNEMDTDFNNKIYYKDFTIYKVPYLEEINNFLLTYKRHPTLFELEKLLNIINLKKQQVSFSSSEEPFLKDKTFLMNPLLTNNKLIVFYAYRREPLVGSFIFYKFFQHRQLERSLRIFIQKKQIENNKFMYDDSFISLDNSFIPVRVINEKLTKEEIQLMRENALKLNNKFSKMTLKLKKNRKKIIKRFFIERKFKKIFNKIKQKKLNMWYNNLSVSSHKNVFNFIGFLYKASLIYLEFFLIVYLIATISIFIF